MRHGLKAQEKAGIRDLIINHGKDIAYLCSVYEVLPEVIDKFAREVMEGIVDPDEAALAESQSRRAEIEAVVIQILEERCVKFDTKICAKIKEKGEAHADAEAALIKNEKAAKKKAKKDGKDSKIASDSSLRVPGKKAKVETE